MMKAIAYYRVSTARQGESGLGLEAQQSAVGKFAASRGYQIDGHHTEVESGKRDDRPELAAALDHCRRSGATLLVAKMDRLSRDAVFLLTLQKSEIKFVAVDQPDVNELVVGILAVVAQAEARMISERTKAALAGRRDRGLPMGFALPSRRDDARAVGDIGRLRGMEAADQHAAEVMPVIEGIRAAGLWKLQEIAQALNARGIKTRRNATWYASTVSAVIKRAAA